MESRLSSDPSACPYESPDSFWILVEKSTPAHERAEIKRMLGNDLVEQSIELHEEVNLLMEIWRDYRDETESMMSRSPVRLPEPPATRERLKQEIKFFIESIREKAKDHGRDANDVIGGNNSTVIQYALDEQCSSSGYGSRPSTARSSTPMMTDRSRSNVLCTLSDEVEAINDKLTYLKFDQVVAHLRETLETEVLRLREDTDFLQKCLDDEVDFRSQSREGMREPSLAELSTERSRLEKELLKPESRVPSVMRDITAPQPIMRDITAPQPIMRDIVNRGSSVTKKDSPTKNILNSITPNAINQYKRPVPPSSSRTLDNARRSPVTPSAAKVSAASRRSPIKASHAVPTIRATAAPQTRSHLKTDSSDSNAHTTPGSQSAYSFHMPEITQHVTIKGAHRALADGHRHCTTTELGEGDVREERKSASTRAARPSSANRFRRMVEKCRDEP